MTASRFVKAFQGTWLVEPEGSTDGVALTACGAIVVYRESGPYFDVFDDLDHAESFGGLDEETALEARLWYRRLTGDRRPVVQELDI